MSNLVKRAFSENERKPLENQGSQGKGSVSLGQEGLEPSTKVLETHVLPYTPLPYRYRNKRGLYPIQSLLSSRLQKNCSDLRVILFQIFLQAQILIPHDQAVLRAHIADMPGLRRKAGDLFLALLIPDDKPVFPAVGVQPFALLRAGEIAGPLAR